MTVVAVIENRSLILTMKAFLSVCIIVAFCIVESLQTTPHKPCDDGPLPSDLRVEGCDETPCLLRKGSDILAQWDFVAVADAEKLKPRVKATFMNKTVNYPFPEQDACKSLTNGQCPLEQDDEVTYNLKMPIAKAYPSMRITIEFALLDENNKVHVCFKLDGKIVGN